MNIAIIFAGGVGSRMKMGAGKPKQFLEIDNIPILVWTIKKFQDNELVDGIVVVMLEKYIKFTKQVIKKYGLAKVRSVVCGGETGQKSIYNGLKEAKKISGNSKDIVLIHDGVRPYFENDLIGRNIEAVKKYGASVSCAPSKETTVIIGDDKNIDKVLDRSEIWLARAPQCFYFGDIMLAHEKYHAIGKNDIIDSCTMMKMEGKEMHRVETCAENIKITTIEDYYTMCGILGEKDKR